MMSEAKAFSALQLGIAAAKEGNHDLARRLLLEATKFDENNRESWLWLATVARSEAERETFLKYAANAQTREAVKAPERNGHAHANGHAEGGGHQHGVMTAVVSPVAVETKTEIGRAHV